MSKIDYELLKELIKEWDSANIVKLIEDAIHCARFINHNGKVMEPFRTILLLKLLGRKPVRLLLSLYYIQQHKGKTPMPDLANFLGDEFNDGNPRTEIRNLLNCLEKLGVLDGEEIRPKGVKTRGFNIRKMELHLCAENIQNILSGKEFDWSQLNVADIIDKEFNSRYKVKNFDGTEITFKPLNMFEALIRYGASSSIAWQIVSVVRNGITEGKYRDMQTINRVVVEELQALSPNIAEAFLKDNPLGLKLKGKPYDGEYLTYDIMEKILCEHLLKYQIKCLPSKPCKEIMLISLSEAMKDLKTKRELEVSEIPEKLQFAIFQVYSKSIDEIVSNISPYLKKARWSLRAAKDKLTSNEPQQAVKPLLGSLSCCLTPLYINVGLLPEKDDLSTASLAKNLLLPSSIEPEVKPQWAEKEIRSKLKEILVEQNIDIGEMVKCIDSLVSIDREEISGITMRDPLMLRTTLNYAYDFVEKIMLSIEGSEIPT